MSGKIVIAGGSGALGSLLVDAYGKAGWEVVVLTRSASSGLGHARYLTWDGETLGDWAETVDGATVVVNLAGKSINTRFTEASKREIWESRVKSTAVVAEAIRRSKRPPRLWINAGGISIYGPSEALRTEADVPDGTGFLAQVARAWEAAFAAAVTPATRKVQFRISSVLLSEGGMLTPLARLVRLGLGGTIGSGRQYLSWIHERDFVKLVDWTAGNQAVQGIVHASSPYPVQNVDFMRALRKRLGMPFGLPSPEWSTRLGARLIGTEPELVLSGRRVVSERLEKAGFQFNFPELRDALQNLVL